MCFRLADLTVAGGFMIVEFILDTLLYPALIYLTFNVSVSSRILNYLGALSFGLYAFQCPARLVRMLGVDNRFILLGLIVALTVIYDLIMRIIRHGKTLEKAPAPSI